MKLLASTENKITEEENTENVPHLETTEVIINKIQEFCIYLFKINHLVVYQKFH